MNCMMCNGPTQGDRIVGTAIVCAKCAPAAQQLRKKVHTELLSEDLGEMPDTLAMPAFERLVLKYALHFMRDIPPQHRDAVLGANPAFLIPEEFARWVKDQVLQQIPGRYVSFVPVVMQDHICPRGEYRFVKGVPARVVKAAMRDTKLVE